jgi:hypothetical protein
MELKAREKESNASILRGSKVRDREEENCY